MPTVEISQNMGKYPSQQMTGGSDLQEEVEREGGREGGGGGGGGGGGRCIYSVTPQYPQCHPSNIFYTTRGQSANSHSSLFPKIFDCKEKSGRQNREQFL